MWYVLEFHNQSADMRQQVGSFGRMLWVSLLTIYGESPWENFSAKGRALHMIMMLLAVPLFGIPCGIFANAFINYMEEMYFNGNDEEDEDSGDESGPSLPHNVLATTGTLEDLLMMKEANVSSPRDAASVVSHPSLYDTSLKANRRFRKRLREEEKLRRCLLPEPHPLRIKLYNWTWKKFGGLQRVYRCILSACALAGTLMTIYLTSHHSAASWYFPYLVLWVQNFKDGKIRYDDAKGYDIVLLDYWGRPKFKFNVHRNSMTNQYKLSAAMIPDDDENSDDAPNSDFPLFFRSYREPDIVFLARFLTEHFVIDDEELQECSKDGTQ